MPIERGALLGPPHSYLVRGTCAGDRPALGAREDRAAFRDLLENLQGVFGFRLYAFAIHPTGYRLVLRHRTHSTETDHRLQERWQRIAPRSTLPGANLRRRFTSLPGLMQTLTQRYSRDHHRRHGGRGTLWANRYRACLLADDAALLAAVVWVEAGGAALPPAASSRDRRGDARPHLAPLPLRRLPDGDMVPADEAPLDMPPPPPAEAERLLRRFAADLAPTSLAAYGDALCRGWCFGRPESLAEARARLGRRSGRGRSRQLRDLDDELGLCGLWG